MKRDSFILVYDIISMILTHKYILTNEIKNKSDFSCLANNSLIPQELSSILWISEPTEWEDWYVISNINEHNKYTRNVRNCQLCILIGEDKQHKDYISCITHHSPDALWSLKDGKYVLNEIGKAFVNKLTSRIKELEWLSTNIECYISWWSIVDNEKDLYLASQSFFKQWFNEHWYSISFSPPAEQNIARWILLDTEQWLIYEVWPSKKYEAA